MWRRSDLHRPGGACSGAANPHVPTARFSVLGTEIKASLETEENKGFSNALAKVAGIHLALATILD